MHAIPKAGHQHHTVKRYWDAPRGIYVAKILPGEWYVTNEHEMISTLLGSCIAVCMRDNRHGIGGMNHFKLPLPQGKNEGSMDANYGIYAMELLINEILKKGGKRPLLEARVFGGGNVLKSVESNIGQKNIDFVTEFLRKEKIPVIGMDVGHESAQHIYYHPVSGNAFSVVSEGADIADIKRAEKEYFEKIDREMNARSVIFMDDNPSQNKK